MESGDPAGTAADSAKVLAGCLRVLGSDHPGTEAPAHSLAYWTGYAGIPPAPVAFRGRPG